MISSIDSPSSFFYDYGSKRPFDGTGYYNMALKKNLDAVIFDKLQEEVLHANWVPGQQISLDEIMAKYDVSRTPVQQALKQMQALGMINHSTRGHFIVPTFSEKNVRDLLEMRCLLEIRALKDIRDKKLKIDMAKLQQYCDDCVAASDAGNLVEARRKDLQFHRTLVAQADNRYLDEAYYRIQNQYMVANYLIANPTNSQESIAAADHVTMMKALRKGDYDGLLKMLEKHITGACDKMLIRMNTAKS